MAGPGQIEEAKKASVESNFGAPNFDVLRHFVLPAAGHEVSHTSQWTETISSNC